MPNFQETDRMALAADYTPKRRKIVCLCGSTKFWRTFQRAGLEETMKGHIVLSIGAAAGTDDDHFGNLSPEEYEAIKDSLDTLHYDKIAMADEILVLDDPGSDGAPYIGNSTRAEIAFAKRFYKGVRYRSIERRRYEPALPACYNCGGKYSSTDRNDIYQCKNCGDTYLPFEPTPQVP